MERTHKTAKRHRHEEIGAEQEFSDSSISHHGGGSGVVIGSYCWVITSFLLFPLFAAPIPSCSGTACNNRCGERAGERAHGPCMTRCEQRTWPARSRLPGLSVLYYLQIGKGRKERGGSLSGRSKNNDHRWADMDPLFPCFRIPRFYE